MTDAADILSEQILLPISKQPRQDPKLTVFMALRGHLYDGSLMVVGRAVNGWEGILP